MRLHREFTTTLQETTGINAEFRERPTRSLAFTERELQAAHTDMAQSGSIEGWATRWGDDADARAIGVPHLLERAWSYLYRGSANVEPYRFVLALLASAENGVTIHHGEVTGLKRAETKVTGVILNNEEIFPRAWFLLPVHGR